MKKFFDFLTSDLGLGLYAGFFLSYVAFHLYGLKFNFAPDWLWPYFKYPEESGWLYAYQTGFTGIVGIITATIIWSQYRSSLYRRRLSERAKMNDALSEICSYAKKCFQAIRVDGQSRPDECPNALCVLKTAIEFVDSKTADSIYELVIHYQVHNARLEEVVRNQQSSIGNIDRPLYDAVKLYALASRLFGYARRSDYSRKNVHSVANNRLALKDMCSALNAIYGHYETIMPYNDPAMQGVLKEIELFHPE